MVRTICLFGAVTLLAAPAVSAQSPEALVGRIKAREAGRTELRLELPWGGAEARVRVAAAVRGAGLAADTSQAGVVLVTGGGTELRVTVEEAEAGWSVVRVPGTGSEAERRVLKALRAARLQPRRQ